MQTPDFTWPRAAIVGLAAAGLTWWATGALLGRTASPPGRPAGFTEVRPPGAPEPDPAAGWQAGASVQRMHMGDMAAYAEGRDVLVTGWADVADDEGSNEYVWTVRAHAVGGLRRLVHERHSAEGRTTLAAGSVGRPEFADAIELPPGEYRVTLTLHVVPRGFDWSAIDRGEDLRERGASQVSAARKVVIP